MKSIAFFLSASDIDRKYIEPALELVSLIVKEEYTFVYGGSEMGLMKLAAMKVHELGGKIVAVSSSEFEHIATNYADELIIADNISHRKQLLLQKSDAIVALVGGSGTFDEITDIIELKKLEIHTKPIAFLNTNNFWDGLIQQYEMMSREGFLSKKVNELFYSSDDPAEVMEYLKREI